jgi:GAF domain-containing protein
MTFHSSPGRSEKVLKRKIPDARPMNLRQSAPSASVAGQESFVAASLPAGDQTEDGRLGRLTTLLEVARMLTSELDLPEIVHQVLVRAIAVIPAADAGTLYLLDSASGRLVVSDSVGFGPSIFKLCLEPGEGAAGRALMTGHGAIYPDPETVQAAVADATPETFQHFRQASRGPRSPKAAMTAPLIFKGTLLGVLVVDAVRSKGEFTPGDLSMLEDFAQIASIAIVNARLYGSEQTRRVRLEVLNDEITRQRDELNRRLSALDSMSEIARQELGLAALTSRLADLTSTRAYILDGLARVRAGEAGQGQKEHARELLESEHCMALLRRVGDDRHPHSIVVAGTQLAACPIVSGADLLGFVLVEATEPGSPKVNEALAEIAALIASTVFVRERALEEGVVRRRVDLLERLLDGDVPKSASSFRALPPPLRLAVGKLSPDDCGKRGRTIDGNILREVRAIAEQVLGTQSTPTVATVRAEYVVLAWSAAHREGRFKAAEKLEEIAAAVLASIGARVRFALTETIGDPHLISQIYQEARLAADIRPWTGSAVIDAGGLGAYRMIIGASSSRQIVEFSMRTLAKAIEHDRKRKGCLISTLRTYLEKGSSLSLAAQALGVHVHTVQYRLGRLEELTRLSHHNPEDRLTLELALRILDLSNPELLTPS